MIEMQAKEGGQKDVLHWEYQHKKRKKEKEKKQNTLSGR